MSTTPIDMAGRYIDFTGRVTKSSTIIASPSTNAETVIATTPKIDPTIFYSLAIIDATIAYTIGTSGSACTVKIEQGAVAAGTLVFSTGAQTGGHNTAGQLVSDEVMAFDTSPSTQYSVTLQVTGGAATSTVSSVMLVVLYL